MNHYHQVDLKRWREFAEPDDRWLPWQGYLRAIRAANLEPPELAGGRGIVIAAGGRLLPGAYVTVRLLREFGCKLPVEIWHLGPGEMPKLWADVFHAEHVSLVDACEVRDSGVWMGGTTRDLNDNPVRHVSADMSSKRPHPIHNLGGWQLKPYSILLSRFGEVLFLDADNHPAKDPTYLFDDPEYKRTGAMFWPDRYDLSPRSQLWNIFEEPVADAVAHETGQILIDKARHWPALNMSVHCNAFSGFYYGHSHGDTQLYRFPIAYCGGEYATIPHRLIEVPVDREVEEIETLKDTPYLREPGDIRAMFLQRDPQGAIIFQHRSAGGGAQAAFTLSTNKPIQHFQHEEKCEGYLRELRESFLEHPMHEVAEVIWPERISPHRKDGLLALLKLMEERQPVEIIETGTLRQPGNWHGDGGLTWWLAEWAAHSGGRLVSVDCDPEAVDTAGAFLESEGLRDAAVLVQSDSLAFMNTRISPIDVLVLDSVDYEGDAEAKHKAQLHSFNELQAAMPRLHARSIIAIDDCGLDNGGKGGVSVPYLLASGWVPVADNYLKVLIKR